MGSQCPVSISHLTLEPQTTQVPLPLAALWPPGVEGDWLGLQWLYHFTSSLLRVLEGLGLGGGRKSWAVKRRGGQLLSSDLQEGLGRTWVSHSLGPSQL